MIKAVRRSLPVGGWRSKISGKKGGPGDQLEEETKGVRGVAELETSLIKVVVEGSGTC